MRKKYANQLRHLLTTFQMFYIYHQVTILANKILIKNISIINAPYGNKSYNIGTRYIDQLNNHLSRGSEEQYIDAKLQI